MRTYEHFLVSYLPTLEDVQKVLDNSAEGSNYTFLSLIGAVIDAPISAFTGMFDFTLLGVNLRSFILAMLTLAIVIVLIRIALGGK